MKILKNQSQYQYKSKVQKDAFDFFSGRRSGHIGYLQYGTTEYKNDPVCGSEIWSKFRHIQDYYLTNEDDGLIKEIIPYISNINLDVETFIDLGPGDYESLLSKTQPLVNASKANRYIAIDMAEIYAQDAARFVATNCAVKSQAVVSDFLQASINIKQEKALLFMGGSTISNIPVGIEVKDATLYLSAQLAKYRSCVDNKSYMLIGFDSNQDEETLDAAYQNHVHSSLVENALFHIHRDTNISFDPSNFKYKGIWIVSEHRYAHCVKVLDSASVNSGFEKISLKKGQILHVDNSYKFPVSILKKAATNAGWNVMNSWTQTGRVNYVLLSSK